MLPPLYKQVHPELKGLQYIFDNKKAHVVICKSAIMLRNGYVGKGLYAGRIFKENEVIGQYEGNTLGVYETRDEAVEAAQEYVENDDKLITLRMPGRKGWHLVSGTNFVALANDPRGTKLRPNCILTEYGKLKVISKKIPAFDVRKSLEENISSEIRIQYGLPYWTVRPEAKKNGDPRPKTLLAT
jgi:hypothetical protein